MIRTRAGYFDVLCNGGAAECQIWCDAQGDEPLEVVVNQHRYRLTDFSWEAADGILTGTMWRVRDSNLPSVILEGVNQQIGSPLAEGASFAYQPSRTKALIQYNHHGPRHTVLSAILEAIGIAAPVLLTPTIVQDALQRMRDAELVRRMEFTLTDVQAADAALGQLPAVSEALAAMQEVHGATIRVEISMGHNRGGLAQNAKSILQSLTQMTDGVRMVKAGVKETQGAAVRMLDLLGGRRILDLAVDEVGLEINHQQLRDRLQVALRDDLDTSDDEVDESEDDADEDA